MLRSEKCNKESGCDKCEYNEIRWTSVSVCKFYQIAMCSTKTTLRDEYQAQLDEVRRIRLENQCLLHDIEQAYVLGKQAILPEKDRQLREICNKLLSIETGLTPWSKDKCEIVENDKEMIFNFFELADQFKNNIETRSTHV